MDDDVAMLRQLIFLLHDSPSAPPQRKCCFNFDKDSNKDGCPSFAIAPERPGTHKMLEPSKPPPAKKPRKERTHWKLLDLSSSTDMTETQIWQNFPEDLFETVIARIPITTFFRFRSVCKKWNSFLSSNSFSQQYSQVPKGQPWFYTITREKAHTGAMYDPSSKKWHHRRILSLPTRINLSPVASAGGLVCFVDIGRRYFYVTNPLTQSFSELPYRSPIKIWPPPAIVMTSNGANKGYKVMSLHSNGEYEVYDSIKGTWACPGPLPSTINVPLNLKFWSHAIYLGTSCYFKRSCPDGIVSYNMTTGIWEQFLIPSPIHLSYHTLAECDGRILLVGLITKNAATCVCVWELQKMTLLWKEVDRMPNIWCLEFYGKHVEMTCLGNKGLLMLSLRSRQMNRLVMYDVANKEWVKVPGCTLPREKKKLSITCGTAFYPCLTASV